ncbi:MAG: hypothetical protein GXO50_05865 [Chlorobi bacterium]|nr:hypothetical protein [Chlorobiota bacterium]
MKNSYKFIAAAIITFISGYLFLRTAYYKTSDLPFTQEIILIVLGTIVTVAVTAALLSKQSEIELEKEQRVKIFDIKSGFYIDLINLIENIITKGTITKKDLITLEFITHKISIIADVNVLKEYYNFIELVKRISEDDDELSVLESDEISLQLAKLCTKIRFDLIIDNNDKDEIDEIITKNIKKI